MTTAEPSSFQSALLGMLSLSQGDFLSSQSNQQPPPPPPDGAAYGTTPLTPPGSPPEEDGKCGAFRFSAGSTAGLAHMPTAAASVGSNSMTSEMTITDQLDQLRATTMHESMSQQQRRNRSEKRPIPDTEKDSKYFERRSRNNMAAKKSRDTRKQREEQVACRAQWFERENAILRAQVQTLREEAQSLRQLIESRQHMQHSVKMQQNIQSFAMNGFHMSHG